MRSCSSTEITGVFVFQACLSKTAPTEMLVKTLLMCCARISLSRNSDNSKTGTVGILANCPTMHIKVLKFKSCVPLKDTGEMESACQTLCCPRVELHSGKHPCTISNGKIRLHIWHLLTLQRLRGPMATRPNLINSQGMVLCVGALWTSQHLKMPNLNLNILQKPVGFDWSRHTWG